MIRVLCFFGVIIICLMTALLVQFFAKEKLWLRLWASERHALDLNNRLTNVNDSCRDWKNEALRLRKEVTELKLYETHRDQAFFGSLNPINKFEVGE